MDDLYNSPLCVDEVLESILDLFDGHLKEREGEYGIIETILQHLTNQASACPMQEASSRLTLRLVVVSNADTTKPYDPLPIFLKCVYLTSIVNVLREKGLLRGGDKRGERCNQGERGDRG